MATHRPKAVVSQFVQAASAECGCLGKYTTMCADADQLTIWAESLIHINHLNTLVKREIDAGHLDRAKQLSERARQRAWIMLNEMFAKGAAKPEGYCEPRTAP